MKFKIILLLVTISISYTSCESEQQGFSIDKCVGTYVCHVDGQTLLVLPSGRKDTPAPPLTNYPKGVTVNVERTGESELTLTFNDQVMVIQVDPEGRLTIPPTKIYLENENFTMSLDATYTAAYITSNMLFIKQVSTGTALCNDKGDEFTLTVTNTQFFDGEKIK